VSSNPNTTIEILQYNLQKGKERTQSVLNDPTSSKFAMLMLQEQYWSAYTKSSFTHQSWTLIESKKSTTKPPRSAIYVNNSIIKMQDYEEVPIPVHDVTAICLRTEGCTKPHLIINIYNPSKEEVITPLIEYVAQHISPQHYHAIIMLGDFNLHHPLWNPR